MLFCAVVVVRVLLLLDKDSAALSIHKKFLSDDEERVFGGSEKSEKFDFRV